MVGSLLPGRLFDQPPVIDFGLEQDHCSHCQTRLKIRKTHPRNVATLHIGPFQARETVAICPACQRIYRSEELRKLVPPGCCFGYDILVYVGKALFLRHRRGREVSEELAARNIPISPSEVAYLGRKFIVYLAIAHRQGAHRIQQAMRLNGGYILHLDATSEGKGPLLMTGLDALAEIVLGNVKLPSEKADEIIPFLEKTKHLFGQPVALVHDMGSGICKAVAKVFPKIPDFICHYHFLRDIGRDLFEGEYDTIRRRLRKDGLTGKLRYRARQLKQVIDANPHLIEALDRCVQNRSVCERAVERMPTIIAYGLIHWVLDGKNQGHGYGFPFDRPHVVFTQRARMLYEQLQEIKKLFLRGAWRENRPLFKLSCDLEALYEDRVLRRTLTEITSKMKEFDSLRDAMRIAPEPGSEGLNSGDADTDAQTIEQNVRGFRQRLRADPVYATEAGYQNMIAQIDKYWEKLFADPITVNTPHGEVNIQPQRTNNLMERFFRDFKRGHRRKTGNKSVSKTLQTMLADTPLVKNLENPQYISPLLDGAQNLEALFAGIDTATVRRQLRDAHNSPDRIPATIKKIITEPTFLATITSIFRAGHETCKSNRVLC